MFVGPDETKTRSGRRALGSRYAELNVAISDVGARRQARRASATPIEPLTDSSCFEATARASSDRPSRTWPR